MATQHVVSPLNSVISSQATLIHSFPALWPPSYHTNCIFQAFELTLLSAWIISPCVVPCSFLLSGSLVNLESLPLPPKEIVLFLCTGFSPQHLLILLDYMLREGRNGL